MSGVLQKVLYVSKIKVHAGTTRKIIAHLSGCDLKNVQIIIVTLNDVWPHDLKELYPTIRFESASLEKYTTIIEWIAFLKLYTPSKVVFVETWFSNFPIDAIIAAWVYTKANVYMEEHTDIPKPEKMKFKIVKFLLSFVMFKYRKVLFLKYRHLFVKKIIAVSEGMKTQLMMYYAYPKAKIEVIYYPIDSDRFSPKYSPSVLRKEKGVSVSDIIYITTARLSADKNIKLLINAFAMLKKQNTQKKLWLWIVGDGDEQGMLRSLAKELHIDASVVFWGYQQDIAPLLQESDCFVLTSLRESFGISILEALSCGVCVVATKTCGATELLQRMPGILVDMTTESVVEGMNQILALTPSERRMQGEKAREGVKKDFSKEELIKKYLKSLDLPAQLNDHSTEIDK